MVQCRIGSGVATMLKEIDAGVLTVAYEETGDPAGWPAVLLHGFPYDIRSYDEVAPHLAAQGARVIVPYLRGYGPTRFRSAGTPRSGEQAALGHDLLMLLDALEIESAGLGGHDRGGGGARHLPGPWAGRGRGPGSGNRHN